MLHKETLFLKKTNKQKEKCQYLTVLTATPADIRWMMVAQPRNRRAHLGCISREKLRLLEEARRHANELFAKNPTGYLPRI